MRFAACHSCIHSSPTCLTCVRRFPAADSPRAGATRGARRAGGEQGTAAFPAPPHPCALLHTCPPPSLLAILAAFAPLHAPCPPSCTPHGRSPSAPHSHSVCPPRCADNFQSIQGCSGVGRARICTGAHTFLPLGFHSVGMYDFGTAGRIAAERVALRTAFSVSSDRVRLDTCSQARFACLRAMLPPQRMQATSPCQHISLSFCNG